jgi:uncharacterized membrane protein YkvA (DUF1232 family)
MTRHSWLTTLQKTTGSPDPIPILGYLDDLILVPLGIAFAIRMIPEDVLYECREKARALEAEGKLTN